MVQILSPTGIEKPEGGELHSRAQYLRNLDRINQTAIDVGKVAKADNQMVFQNVGYLWNASASWDSGALSLNTGTEASSQMSSPQPSFAQAGSVSGALKFNEAGIYSLTWLIKPSGEPGNAGYKVVPYGTWPGNPVSVGDTTFAQDVHIANSTYWETFLKAPFIRVPQAGLEIRLVGIQINSTTNSALVRLRQMGKL